MAELTLVGLRVVREVAARGSFTALLELGGLRYRLEGWVAIAAFPSALGVLVPRALANLRRRHPAVVTTLREGSTPTHLRRLRAGHLEAAVIAVGADLPPYRLDDLRIDLLIEGGLLVAVPETHRLARRGTVDVAELEDEAWIVGDGGDGPSSASGQAVRHLADRIHGAGLDRPARSRRRRTRAGRHPHPGRGHGPVRGPPDRG